MGNFRVGIFRVGVSLGGNCPGGTYPGWGFSLVEVFRVGIVRWESSGWGFSCYHKTYHATNLYTLQSNLLLESNQPNGFVSSPMFVTSSETGADLGSSICSIC